MATRKHKAIRAAKHVHAKISNTSNTNNEENTDEAAAAVAAAVEVAVVAEAVEVTAAASAAAAAEAMAAAAGEGEGKNNLTKVAKDEIAKRAHAELSNTYNTNIEENTDEAAAAVAAEVAVAAEAVKAATVASAAVVLRPWRLRQGRGRGRITSPRPPKTRSGPPPCPRNPPPNSSFLISTPPITKRLTRSTHSLPSISPKQRNALSGQEWSTSTPVG